MKKLFTLLTMLIVAISTSWAATTKEVYFVKAADNPGTQSTIFSGAPADGGNFTISFTVDDVEYTPSRRSSNTQSSITFTLAQGKTARLWAVHNQSSRNYTLKLGQTTITAVTSETGFTPSASGCYADVFDITDAGTYTLSNSQNIGLVCLILKIEDSAPEEPYTVTFNAGEYGTCATSSATEAEAGAGVTLPEVTPNSGYVFNGWFTAATGGEKAGDAGKNYKPSADNTPLYAQYSEIPTPTFVLSATSIEVGQTAQIKVTGKDDLDGVTLSDINYGTADIVTVNATTGEVTPVAAGSTTITFNSSAVDGKYKASSGNLSITVTAPKCATPTISPVSFSTDNQEVTITSETDGATIYYTTNGATPSTNSLVYDSENKPTISSTTTFKAIAVKENYDDSEVATQKITRTSSAVVASWDFTNWSDATQAGVRADDTNWRDYETSADTKPLNDKVYSNKVANTTFVYGETTIPETEGLSFKNTAYTFGLAFDQASTSLGTYHGSQYLWLYGSNSTITIPSLSAGSTIEIGLESHKKDGTSDATRKLTVTNTNEGSYSTEDYTEQTFTVTADGDVTITPSKGMHIYYIKVTSNVETEGITTDNGVATYVTKNALDFTGLETKAYVVKSVDTKKNKVFTEEVTTVPAGTALLVKGATVNVPVIASATDPATNMLQISNGSVTGAAGNIFAYSKSSKQFKKVASTVTIPSGKCYLVINGSTESLDVDFEDEATAVEAIAEADEAAAAPIKVIKGGKLYIGNYNVAGQQVK